MLSRRPSLSQVHGFSLVELMVSLALGMVVIGAVITLIVALMRANNQTIQATRLTQELRATAAVIASDLKRAGGVDDPFTAATANAGKPLNQFAAVNDEDAGCIRYAYARDGGNNFHAISRNVGTNAVHLYSAADFASATCNHAASVRLGSGGVSIDALDFVVTGRKIHVTLAGSLVSNPAIRRTFTQTVFIRSVAGS